MLNSMFVSRLAPLHTSSVHGFPSSYTLGVKTTSVATPLMSHFFCWQLPYCCDGATSAVYSTTHLPPVQATFPNEAHGPGGTATVAHIDASLHSTDDVVPPVPPVPPPPGLVD